MSPAVRSRRLGGLGRRPDVATELDPRLRETQLTCVLTRIELAHLWQAPRLWLLYRRARRSMRGARHLLAIRLLVESPRVYFSLSIWSRPFGTAEAATPDHLQAVRFGYYRCRATWSTQWHMTRLSPSSRNWPGSGVDWDELARLSGVDQTHAAAVTYCAGPVLDLRPRAPAP